MGPSVSIDLMDTTANVLKVKGNIRLSSKGDIVLIMFLLSKDSCCGLNRKSQITH